MPGKNRASRQAKSEEYKIKLKDSQVHGTAAPSVANIVDMNKLRVSSVGLCKQ